MSHALADRPVGIYEKALPPLPWHELLSSAGRTGFDFVEMSIDESPERLARLEWPSETRARLHRAIDDIGIPVYSICLSAHRRFGLGSADADVRREAARILREAVRLASDLGIRIVQIAGYFAYYEDADSTSRLRYVEGLAKGLDVASELGVMLGVENIDTTDMASADDALRLVKDLSSPWFRIYPDVGNFAVHALDVVDNLAKVADQAVGLHLKDARVGEPRRVPYGEGTVPFADVFSRLASLPYAGPLTLEMWNDDPGRALDDAAGALRWVKDGLRAADAAVLVSRPLI